MSRIKLTPGFFFFLALLWYLDAFGTFWSFLAALTVHELAHAAVIAAFGGKIESLRLGFAELRLETGLLGNCAEFWSAAAGPAVNLLCGCTLGRFVPVFAAVSLLLGLFNLLPVWPLDGGRMLLSGLRRFDCAHAEVTAYTAGVVCGLVMLLTALWACLCLSCGIWPLFAAVLLLLRLFGMRRAEKPVAFLRV